MKSRPVSCLARLFFILGLLFAFGPQVRAWTINWTKYDNTIPAVEDGSSTNGKIPLGNANKGDDGQVLFPAVLKDGATYKIWYTGNDEARWRVYHATSPNGLEWTKYDNTTPENSDTNSTNGRIPLGSNGKGDDWWVVPSSVIKDGSTYKMWYDGYDSTTWRIYYATSSNSLVWTKLDNTIPENSDGASTNGKIPLGTVGKGDSTGVRLASVLKDGATYKMWYMGLDGTTNGRIYYATSSNGLEWTKLDNTIPENSNGSSTNGKIPLGTPGKGDDSGLGGLSVLKDGSTYKLWYGGVSGGTAFFYHATSPDGLVWTKYDNTIPPVSDTTNSNSRLGLGTANRGDDASLSVPAVLKEGYKYMMWYTGYDGAKYRIYHATSPPPAGTIFTFR